MSRGDAEGCASALEELIKLREEHGPEDKVGQYNMGTADDSYTPRSTFFYHHLL
jgi:hypothetical protein